MLLYDHLERAVSVFLGDLRWEKFLRMNGWIYIYDEICTPDSDVRTEDVFMDRYSEVQRSDL